MNDLIAKIPSTKVFLRSFLKEIRDERIKKHLKEKDTRIPILIRFDGKSSTQLFEDYFIKFVSIINFDD